MEYVCLLTPLIGLLSKIKCRFIRYHGIVIPKKSGKTHLSKVLEKKDWILLDIENSVKLHLSADEQNKLNVLQDAGEKQSYDSFYYPLCKNHFESLKKDFKKKSIIVLSSDAELLKYLNISNILHLAPSNKLFTDILNKEHDPNLKKLIQASRDMIIQSSGKKLKAYDSVENLIQIVSSRFSLNYKL
jgi:hypothetical protein